MATLPVPLEESDQFGVLDVDSGLRVFGFDEKPRNARANARCARQMPGLDGQLSVRSAGAARGADRRAEDRNSGHDFGRDLIPALIDHVPVYAYNFMTNRIRGDSEENLSLLARRGDDRRLL